MAIDLQFLIKLSEQEILDLINRCILSLNEQITDPDLKKRYVDQVNIYAEDDRREKGCRVMFVTTLSNQVYIGNSFQISDFSMTSLNCVNPQLNIDFSHVLKAFMTQKFGQEYIEALHNLRVQEADAESQTLQQYLSSTRK